MTIRSLEIFLAVTQNGNNITKAAKKLYISQPSVTAAIKDLEQEYGAHLFERLSHRLYLTEAGEEFYKYALRITSLVTDLDKAMKSLHETPSLRIGASMTIGSYLLPDFIKTFKTQYPAAKTKVLVAPSRLLEQKILTNELDFALTETPTHVENLSVTRFRTDPLEIAAPAGSRWKSGETLTVKEFLAQPLLLREVGSGARDHFDRLLADAGLKAAPIWEAQSDIALINAVASGVGITVLPRLALESPAVRGEIVRLKLKGFNFGQQFFTVQHKDKVLTEGMRNFMALCR